ncbi:MAG: CsbD family protein [bacterium]
MNKDQVKGAVKNSVGKMQQEAGKVVDSKEQQAKGIKKQVAGQTQKMVGDGKAAVKKS